MSGLFVDPHQALTRPVAVEAAVLRAWSRGTPVPRPQSPSVATLLLCLVNTTPPLRRPCYRWPGPNQVGSAFILASANERGKAAPRVAGAAPKPHTSSKSLAVRENVTCAPCKSSGISQALVCGAHRRRKLTWATPEWTNLVLRSDPDYQEL